MSTQQETGIDFSLVPEENQQHFRLLELPAELLSVVTADNAFPLQLKSLEAPPGSLSGPDVVLCTQDNTYNIRQVSTSNSVFVVQPTIPPDDTLSNPGIQAIAQCTSTLELLTEKTSVSAASHIKTILPVYTHDLPAAVSTRITKQQLIDSLPLSQLECEQAWRNLACVQLRDISMIPSDPTRLRAWRTILTTATAEQIDLIGEIGDQQWQVLTSDEPEWNSALLEAVLCSVSDQERPFLLDGNKLALSIGVLLLKERTANGRNAIPLQSFQTEWADLMPEPWRDKASIERLDGKFRRENGGKDIAFFDADGSQATRADGGAPADAKSTPGAKRKWHEKFKAAKKTA